VLILDEPSLGLAPIIVDAMYDAIEAIAELDVAILLIEQAVESALHVAEHVIIIDRGAIVDEGPVSDFRDGSRLAASYLGAQSATTKAEEDHGK
jgi:branched-chain amino acid transport system ATP-binding protein